MEFLTGGFLQNCRFHSHAALPKVWGAEMQRWPTAWLASIRNINKLVREQQRGRLIRKHLLLILGLRELLEEFRRFAESKAENMQAHMEEEFVKTETLCMYEQYHLGFCTQAGLTELCFKEGDTFSSLRPNNGLFNHTLWLAADSALNQAKGEQIICLYVIFIFFLPCLHFS